MELSNNLVAQRIFSTITVEFYANSIEELCQKKVVYLMVVPTNNGDYCYVGQAGYGVYKRMCSHCSDAFKRTDNSKKANAIKKYKHIKAYILKVCSDDIGLDLEERKYILQYYNDKNYARCLNTLLSVGPDRNRQTIKSVDDKYQIEQYSLSGEYMQTYDSIRDAARKTGARRNLISRVVNKQAATAGGYQWKRKSDDTQIGPTIPHCARIRKEERHMRHIFKEYQKRQMGPIETREEKKRREQENRGIKVEQYDLNGNLIAVHPSLHEAAKQSGVNLRGVSFCCDGKYKQCNGFQFKKVGSDRVIYNNLKPKKQNTIEFNIATKGKPVGGFNERGELVEEYRSKNQAEKAHNAHGLINNIKSNTKRFGLYWKFI